MHIPALYLCALVSRKWLIAFPVIAIVAVLVIMKAGSGPSNIAVQELPADESLTTLEMFERRMLTHVIETRFEGGVVEIRRGETAEIPFTIIHHSHVWWEPVTVKGFYNRFANYSPSGQEIVITSVSYSPTSVFLWGNASETATMKVLIPEAMPDEMLGRTAIIMASFTFETWYSYDISKKTGYVEVKIVP
jgi:hypothetical protein